MNAFRIVRRSAWSGRIPRSATTSSRYRAFDPRRLSFRFHSTEEKPSDATQESSASTQEAELPPVSKEQTLIEKKDAEILELQVSRVVHS